MNTKEINKQVFDRLEYDKEKYEGEFKGILAYNYLEMIKENNESPIQFLKGHYGDKGLIYHIDGSLYLDYYSELEEVVRKYPSSSEEHISFGSYLNDAVWLGQQTFIQELLLELGVVSAKDVLYR